MSPAERIAELRRLRAQPSNKTLAVFEAKDADALLAIAEAALDVAPHQMTPHLEDALARLGGGEERGDDQ